MPTGYTATLAQGEQSIEDFIKDLARGMGFCISMRDEPFNAPLPKQFEYSSYHPECLNKAKSRLDELRKMTAEGRAKQADEASAHEQTGFYDRAQSRSAQAARYREMLDALNNWKPEHDAIQSLKTFGISQLSESMRFDIYPMGDPPPTLTPAEWFDREIAKAERNIEYHSKEWENEKRRVDERNECLAELRKEIDKLRAVS